MGGLFQPGTGISAPVVDNSPIDVTAASQQTVPNKRYYANRASRVMFLLPAVADLFLGAQVSIRGKGAGGWKVAQNDGQLIRGASNTTRGTAGYLQSQTSSDTVALECIAVDTTNSTADFIIISNRGTLDIA